MDKGFIDTPSASQSDFVDKSGGHCSLPTSDNPCCRSASHARRLPPTLFRRFIALACTAAVVALVIAGGIALVAHLLR